MSDTVECPYCGHDNDMTDALCDLGSSNKFDWECGECEEEFEVEVEFEPSYSSQKIIYIDCEKCGVNTRDFYHKGIIVPFPKLLGEKKVCVECWRKAYAAELRDNQ